MIVFYLDLSIYNFYIIDLSYLKNSIYKLENKIKNYKSNLIKFIKFIKRIG